ncbi:hypothetical protein JMG10_39940 [Nostoc ellipsosporum NOK]|nr:hypothetical protein [Nostoc ellipsosporum NOK]
MKIIVTATCRILFYFFVKEAIALTPDGKYLISGSSDNTVKVWDLQSKLEIASFLGESSIRCCTVGPDGITIVAGEQSGHLHFLCLEGIKVS